MMDCIQNNRFYITYAYVATIFNKEILINPTSYFLYQSTINLRYGDLVLLN